MSDDAYNVPTYGFPRDGTREKHAGWQAPLLLGNVTPLTDWLARLHAAGGTDLSSLLERPYAT